jgi:hypothetical protein
MFQMRMVTLSMNTRKQRAFHSFYPEDFYSRSGLETLGKNYTYTTTSSYSGSISGGTLNGISLSVPMGILRWEAGGMMPTNRKILKRS